MDVQLARINAAGRLLLVATLGAALLTSCSLEPEALPGELPTAPQAKELIDEVVRRAQADDFVGLCELGGPNCETILEAAGLDVPADPPTVAVNLPMREARGLGEPGNVRLVIVCGLAEDGDQYVTEIAVMWDGETLLAAEPVYWSGLTVSTSGSGAGEPEVPEASPPPGC